MHSLNRLRFRAHVEGHEAILVHSVGVGTVGQQQLGTFGLAFLTGLVQSGGATRRQVHTGASQEQVLQALGEATPSCDVQGRGQLLLIGERPDSCEEVEGRLFQLFTQKCQQMCFLHSLPASTKKTQILKPFWLWPS